MGKSGMNLRASPLELIQRGMDAVVVVLAGLASHAFRFGQTTPNKDYIALMIISALLVLLIFPMFKLYRSRRGELQIELIGNLAAAGGAVFISLAVILFALKIGGEYSRIWFFLWGGMAAGGIILTRFSMYTLLRAMRRRGLNHKRIAIIGAGPLAREILLRIHNSPWAGFDVAAIFTPYDRYADDGSMSLDNLPHFIQKTKLDEIWIAMPLRDETTILNVLHTLRHQTMTVRYIPEMSALRILSHDVSNILGMPMIDLRTSPMTGMNRVIKELEDRILALIFLLLASPFMAFIALSVKLSSPGPVLFKQKRHGWGGREINIYKFRTMYVDHPTSEGVKQTTRDDPRVTRIGRFLRRTSLDELPQLINVLQGRMSLVGPRPHAIEHNEFFKEKVDSYMQRHKVKPGITGWAQVNGLRGETDTLEKMQKRVEYDLYYIEHWSLGFDLKILALTFIHGFIHKNAY